MHVSRLHFTVTRRFAIVGILTQIVFAGTAALILWRLGGC
jgi:hypothetical protein